MDFEKKLKLSKIPLAVAGKTRKTFPVLNYKLVNERLGFPRYGIGESRMFSG